MDLWLGNAAPPSFSLASTIHTWGCAAWAHTHSQFRNKLEPKAEKHLLLGYDERRCCYRLGKLPGYRIKFSGHVTFNEDDLPCRSEKAERVAPRLTSSHSVTHCLSSFPSLCTQPTNLSTPQPVVPSGHGPHQASSLRT